MKLAASLLGLAIALASASALALTQADGTPIPTKPGCNSGKPTGLASVFACICKQPGVCNIGDACPGNMDPNSCDKGQKGDCESTMWHDWNDDTCIPSNVSGLDPYAEAATVPETFHPTCAQTFTVRSRGTAIFGDIFGWYNVTGAAPSPDDLHVMLDCKAKAGDQVVLDLAKEPAYEGGAIGFFLATPEDAGKPGSCEAGDCCATVDRAKSGKGRIYFTERKYNPDAKQDAYIHDLIYPSHIFDHTFYFAWEDSFGGNVGNDFTDLVASVEGIECGGGGEACDTGQKGVCAGGITKCAAGQVSCQPVFQAKAEACNGLDDDCNGAIDDGATCDKPGNVCWQGACVGPCSNGEFVCPPSKTCDAKTELCVDADCVGKACGEGEVCRGGACGKPCDGVVCPHGQECVGDACVDLCKLVTCGATEVCLKGQCFSACNQCGGIACTAPLACDTGTGECADPSCDPACPAGKYCAAGACKDACDGAVCPKGQSCVNGACTYGGSGAGGSGAGGFGSGGDGSGNAGQGTIGGAGGAAAGLDGSIDDGEGGCGCRAAGAPGGAAGAAGLALAALAMAARRRRG